MLLLGVTYWSYFSWNTSSNDLVHCDGLGRLPFYPSHCCCFFILLVLLLSSPTLHKMLVRAPYGYLSPSLGCLFSSSRVFIDAAQNGVSQRCQHNTHLAHHFQSSHLPIVTHCHDTSVTVIPLSCLSVLQCTAFTDNLSLGSWGRPFTQ